MINLRATVLVMALVGCGGDDDGGGGGGVAITDFGQRFADAYCTKAFSCCTTAEIPEYFDFFTFTTEAECKQTYGALFAGLTQMYQTSIDAGKIVYNASSAGACLDAVSALSCPQFATDEDTLNDRCPNPFEGQVANDMPCASDEECQSTYCEGDRQGNTPTNGVCKAIPAQGQMCTDFVCAQGSYCDSGTCAPAQADGAECFDGEECMSGGCNGAMDSTPGTCGTAMLCDGP